MECRNRSIDLLRFIALTGIIIAHIDPPSFWMQLRGFDVPLMVFLSGVSYRISGGNKQNYWSYAVKRFKRLILPVWVFLTIYFTLYEVLKGELIPAKTVFSYYSLMTSWFVWIIRVFFVIALVSPLLSPILDRMEKRSFMWYIGAFLLLFEIYLSSKYSKFPGNTILLMNFSYIVVFAIGYKIESYTRKDIFKTACVFMGIYICLMLCYFNIQVGYFPTQHVKYPPRLYYLSYAMALSLFLWMIKDALLRWLEKITHRLVLLISYIGSHTIWIYLWHIPLLSLAARLDSAFLRFSVVFVLATLVAYVQAELVLRLTSKLPNSRWKKNLRMVFIG